VSTAQWAVAFLGRVTQFAVLAVGTALIVQAAARWAGPLWWAWTAGALAVAVVGAAHLVPAALARAATEVAPLGRPELEARLSALAVRVGVPAIQVLAWKAARSARTSAILVGAGRSRRVLVAESVLDSHADDEIEVIVAHELAHSVRGDIWRSSALAVAAGAACLFVSARAVEVLDGALAVGAPGDLASLPLIVLVCRGVWGALSPVANAMSRAQERRADRDALAWTQNAPALVRTLRRLGAAHLAEDRPSRLSGAFFGRHPPLSERIAAAERWQRQASTLNAQGSLPNRVRN
jgi:STE24 endopeptidase